MSATYAPLLIHRLKRPLQLVILCCLFLPLSGMTWDDGGIRYSGDPDDIRALKAATTALRALTGLSSVVGQNVSAEQIRRATWSVRAQRLRVHLAPVPSPPGALDPPDAVVPPDTASSCVQTVLREYLKDMRAEMYDRPEIYQQWIASLVPLWHQHPTGAAIIVPIARHWAEDPEHAHRSFGQLLSALGDHGMYRFEERFDMAAQMALRRQAERLEQRGDYAAAISLLNSWQIREPCGTGIMRTERDRMFWIWRLRIQHGADEQALIAEIWQTMEQGGTFSGGSCSGTVIALFSLPWSQRCDLAAAAAARLRAYETGHMVPDPDHLTMMRTMLSDIGQVAAAEAHVSTFSLAELVNLLCPVRHGHKPFRVPEPINVLYASHQRGDPVFLRSSQFARQRYALSCGMTFLRRSVVIAEIGRRDLRRRLSMLSDAWRQRQQSTALLALMVDPNPTARSDALRVLSQMTGGESTVALLIIGSACQRLQVVHAQARRYQTAPPVEVRIHTLLRQTSVIPTVQAAEERARFP